MRRWFTLPVLALVACSRTQRIELPVCAGGGPLEPEAKHVLAIGAHGRVEIDGAWCRTEPDVDAKLEQLVLSMHNNEELATRIGFVQAPDEPWIVRADGRVQFQHVAKWVGRARGGFHMYRTRVGVRDPVEQQERFLALDREPPQQQGDVPFNPYWKPGHDRVLVMFDADDQPWWNKTGHAPLWRALWWRDPQQAGEWQATSWDQVRARVLELPAYDRDFVIEAALPPDMPWSEVVAIIGDAMSSMHAEIEILGR